MKFAFQRCLDFIRKAPESDDTWAKVDDILKEARLVNRQTDLGLDYFNTVEDRYARMAAEELTKDVFTTGFLTIDHALQGGGMYRGELLAWMGKPGTGKSLSLVTASVKNVAQGKKVLYISTEMDSDRIATRFDAQFCLIGQHELMERKEEVYKALHDEVRDYDDKRRLVIKQFPSGTADVNTIRAFHSQCVINGFRPDLVIIDYPGDMKHSTHIKKYESMQNVLTDLRGFGGEEHHLTMVAIQPNRSSTELGVEEFMDESNQGDSFGQNRVLDLFATLNQTPHEQKAAVGRVFLAKVRNGKSRISFKIKYGFPTQTLTIDEISDETYRMLMSKVQDKDVESVETKIDKIITGGTGSFVPGEGEEIG
jgi:archaellum biogenesis ATPase FlaH